MTQADFSDTPETSLPTTEEGSVDTSFGDILSEFEQAQHSEETGGTMEGTVVSVTPDAVFVDIGRKTDVKPDYSIRDLSEMIPIVDELMAAR